MIEDIRPFIAEIYQTWEYTNQKIQALSRQFEKNDLRLTFFLRISGLLIGYYLAHTSKLYLHYFHPLPPITPFLEEDFKHLQNYTSSLNLLEPDKTVASHINYDQYLVVNLLIGPWIAFESSIHILYHSDVISGESRQKKELEKYFNLLRILRSQNIDLHLITQERLKKLFTDNYISPLHKWNTVFKLVKADYLRDINQDKIFLEFYQHCRNCMHNNFRASSDKTFATSMGLYAFIKDRYPEFLTPNLILKMIKELQDIAESIFKALPPILLINDPHYEEN